MLFTELEKLWVFFLMPDLIAKLHLESNALLSTTVRIIVITVIVGKG